MALSLSLSLSVSMSVSVSMSMSVSLSVLCRWHTQWSSVQCEAVFHVKFSTPWEVPPLRPRRVGQDLVEFPYGEAQLWQCSNKCRLDYSSDIAPIHGEQEWKFSTSNSTSRWVQLPIGSTAIPIGRVATHRENSYTPGVQEPRLEFIRDLWGVQKSMGVQGMAAIFREWWLSDLIKTSF